MHPLGTDHVDGLYRYALVLTRSSEDAEDLVQDTYVRAIKAYRNLSHESNVKGWLFTILRNLWLNRLRDSKAAPAMLEMDEDSSGEGLHGAGLDALSLLQEKEAAFRIRSAIGRLPQEFQEVLLLRAFEDLSYKEIAEVLGCPMGTVMSRLCRARERLRELLDGL